MHEEKNKKNNQPTKGRKKQPKAGITTNHFESIESSFLLFLEVTVPVVNVVFFFSWIS